MATHYPIGDLVCEATVLADLDRNPPPMEFNKDFGIAEIEGLKVGNNFDANAGLDFLNKGPMLS